MTHGFKNILVTTDLSDLSYQAIPVALDLAAKYDGKVTVLMSVEYPFFFSYLGTGPDINPVQILKEVKPEVARRIQQPLDRLAPRVPVEVKVIESPNPASAIVDHAKDNDFDLIVMATHGRSGFARALLGSTTERVVRTSTVPVLTVHVTEDSDNSAETGKA